MHQLQTLRTARHRATHSILIAASLMLQGGGLSIRSNVCAAPPRATARADGIDVSQVLAKVREAVGYDHLTRYKHGIIAEGTASEYGVNGTYSLTFTPDGRFLEVVESRLGRKVGFDGKSGWCVDHSGMPRALGLSELEFWKLTTWITTGRWLEPDSGCVLSILKHSTNKQQLALSIKFEAGVWELWILIDRDSWLPINVVTPWNKAAAIVFQNYRPALGFMFPHDIQKAAGKAPIRYKIRAVREVSPGEQDPYAPITKRPEDVRFYRFASPNIEFRFGKLYVILVRPHT